MSNKAQNPALNNKKAQRGTYRKANIALGLSAIGLAVAYPFQSSFLGGLFTSGCSAALVGGLADWFAVNALFRRPLGIPAGKVFRTEIIPRNRERIFQALSSMVENELLSPKALKMKLEAYDFSATALGIWNTLDKERVGPLLTQCLQQFQESLSNNLRELDLEKEGVALFEQESIREAHFLPLAEKALNNLLDSEEGNKALESILETLSHWVQDTEVQFWLTHWLDKSIERYISQNPSRRLLVMFLPEPSQLAQNIQNQLADYLLEEQTKADVLEWLKNQIKLSSTFLPGQTEPSKDAGDEDNKNSSPLVYRIYSKLRQNSTVNLVRKLQDPESPLTISKLLLHRLEGEAASLKDNLEKRQQFNQSVQNILIPLLENKHYKIGQIVHEGLEKYSDEMLVELIESKAGNDLQMIRINGSVVGGLAGMLIYLVSQAFI